MRAKRSAAAPEASARSTGPSASPWSPASPPRTSISRASALVTAWSRASRRRPARKSIGLPHLERVPHVVAQHLVHVGEPRDRPEARIAGHRDQALRQRLRALEGPREGAGADLHVHDESVEPGRQLLREDRRRDERDRVDGGRDVADRVEPPVRGRQLRRRADDRAPGLAHGLAGIGRGPARCRSPGCSRACRGYRPCDPALGPRSSAPRPRTPRPAARGSG